MSPKQREIWLVKILPMLPAFLIGALVGLQFESFGVRCAMGYPVFIIAYFLYRAWGKYICSKLNSA